MDQTVKATTSSSNLQLRNLTKVFGQGNEKVTADAMRLSDSANLKEAIRRSERTQK
jgi:hypothetical protein